MPLELPEDFESWSLEGKKTFLSKVKYDWKLWARPEQLAPPDDDWDIWLLLAGRGFGKTRLGSEFIRDMMESKPNVRVGMVGMTAGAVRDTMLEGESGLMSVTPPEQVRKYNRSLGQVTFMNGSRAFSFSGADPEKLRGFQSHYLWMDELCAMQYQRETWDMSIMGLRLGEHPRVIVTTTPKPTPLIVELVNRSRQEPERVRITTGSTFDNSANLPASTIAALRSKYEGTTLGRQELYAELILEDPDALWKRPQLDKTRVGIQGFDYRQLTNIVIGVDPSMAQNAERISETGIIVAGLGPNGHGFVIDDASITRPSPNEWARMVVAKYKQYLANKVVAEVNQGFDLVLNTISTADPNVPVKRVYASRGKLTRAEPIAALYEQGRVHHVGTYPELEDQMTSWVPGRPSPDRLDALVWCLTQLMLGGGIAEFYTGTGSEPIPRLISGGVRSINIPSR